MVRFFFSGTGLSARAEPLAASTAKATAEIVETRFIASSVALRRYISISKSQRFVLQNILQHMAGNANVDARAFLLNQHGGAGGAFAPALVQPVRHLGECHIGKARGHADLAAERGGKCHVLVGELERESRVVEF